MTNIHYPKCPHCKTMYTNKSNFDYALMDLATKGWVKEQKVKCPSCEAEYLVTLTLMYYSKKLKGSDKEYGKTQTPNVSLNGHLEMP